MSMTKKPVPPPPGDRSVRTAPPPPPGWRYWLWPAALLVTVLLYFVLPAVHGQTPVNLNYSQFSSQVTAHKVKTVTFASGASGSNTSASGTLTNGKTYETVIPGGPSTAFSQQLSSDGVKVTADPPSSGLGSEVLSWLILLLPLIFIFYLFRRMAKNSGAAGGLQGVLGVGRSRAKIFDAEQPHTKFSDVAGYEGAKAEIGEVVDFLRNPQRYAKAGAMAPRGVLMIGPPGTGKTLLARAVAGGPGCRSSPWRAPASWRCSSASARPGCATFSPRPASGRPRSSSWTRSTPSASAGPARARPCPTTSASRR